jgi:Zn-dependent protease with chaperone function/transcription elongation factor Elf1
MFCTNCGVHLPDSARFCNQCGTPVAPPSSVSANPVLISPPGSYSQQEIIVTGDVCRTCGKSVAGLQIACPFCGTLLSPPATHNILPEEFEHPAMQQMNQLLRQSTTLNSMATMLSKKVGKPWYESCFTSIRTSEQHYPKVYELAAIAARRIGVDRIPPVHIEADRMYQSATYGSMQDAFINIGTLIPRLLNDQELLFILGHEFGHLVSNHALWTTVSMFLVGQHRNTIMAEGILKYFSNPLKVVEQGVESLIGNWLRVAEYTADRAALLVVGDFEIARRALFLLYFRSRRELQEIDLNAWQQSLETGDPGTQKISQIASSTPYLGPRLKELAEFYRSPRFAQLRKKIDDGCRLKLPELFNEKGALVRFAPVHEANLLSARSTTRHPSAPSPTISGRCPHCRADLKLSVDRNTMTETQTITCAACDGTFTLNLTKILGTAVPMAVQTQNARSARAPRQDLTTAPPGGARPLDPTEAPASTADSDQTVRGTCPACGARFSLARSATAGSKRTALRCTTCGTGFTIDLSRLPTGRPVAGSRPEAAS